MISTNLVVIERNDISGTLQDDAFFFHSPDFISTRSTDTFAFDLEYQDVLLARIFFSIQGSTAVSLFKSPFGSFDLTRAIKKEQLMFFIKEIIRKLEMKGCTEMQITSFPKFYHQEYFQLIEEVLLHFDFTIKESFVNQYLLIDDNTFFDVVKSDERRYLNRAAKFGFEFNQFGIGELKAAYYLIQKSRHPKGYSVSMSFEELLKMVDLFPDHYLIFGIHKGRRLIASSISIVVNDYILYDFYHGDDLQFRKDSPVVPLLKGVYEYARDHGFKMLDMGTSINVGVHSFKKSMGALDSIKSVYQRLF